MKGITKRGTLSNPRYYVRYKDLDGTRRMRFAGTTLAQAKKILIAAEGNVLKGRAGIADPKPKGKCGPLMTEWIESLGNRDVKNDRSRFKNHLLPHWADVAMEEAQGVHLVLRWIDQQRKSGEVSEQLIKHNLALLSRFFGWAIEHRKAEVNPVKMLPARRRPHRVIDREADWIGDDSTVLAIMEKLRPREPADLMFFLANRSGLRTGEVCGLRMGDLQWLGEGAIRVGRSYNGPLKEDKRGEGKVKWVPAPDDWAEHLDPWLQRRRDAGARAEDLVFPAPPAPRSPRRIPGWAGFRRETLHTYWIAARDAVNAEALVNGAKEPPIPPTITWYQATRHSFVTRNLAAGAQLDEVSAAVGHGSTDTTRTNYDHFVRRKFSPLLTAPLSRADGGPVPGGSQPPPPGSAPPTAPGAQLDRADERPTRLVN